MSLPEFREWLESKRPSDYKDEDRDIYFAERGREEMLDEVLAKLNEIIAEEAKR